MNDGPRSIFDADQHSEVHLAGNDYSFALICKKSAKARSYKTDFSIWTVHSTGIIVGALM